jgi:hypothetical protein
LDNHQGLVFVMKNRLSLFFIPLFLFFAEVIAYTQGFIWNIDYFGFFDNREYFNKYVNDQTIFGLRINGGIGYALNEKSRIVTAVDYLYEYGSKGELKAPDIIAYYEGRSSKLDLAFGVFPRRNKIDMPLALMTDTFSYYRPNIEGIFVRYHTRGFRHDIWIDWTGRQSFHKRESFLLGFSGEANKGIFIYQHHFVMSHLAHSMNDSIEEHIRDNGGFSVRAGIDLSSVTGLDSLAFSAGLLGSYDRIRNVYDFSVPLGWIGDMEVKYKHIGLHGLIYKGESQVITSGDGFYKSAFYSRVDMYYQVKTRNIEGRLQFSMHFIPGIMDLSMSFLLRANIEGVIKAHQSN